MKKCVYNKNKYVVTQYSRPQYYYIMCVSYCSLQVLINVRFSTNKRILIEQCSHVRVHRTKLSVTILLLVVSNYPKQRVSNSFYWNRPRITKHIAPRQCFERLWNIILMITHFVQNIKLSGNQIRIHTMLE